LAGSAGLLGAGAVGAQAWISPAEATRPRARKKPRREVRDRWVRSIMAASAPPDPTGTSI
jgi:hypothetical protein